MDFRAEPFKTMVVPGESHVAGACATEQSRRWVNIAADIWAAEGQADWVIHPDTVHANDLGHLLIANRVFEAIATHCSGVARGSR